ncbi:MAG TPA: hypothetical protein VHQ47_21055 [Phycisphaerae bacterium]|nr:hypothetical protein [Phycisphaerae bacterium]
MRGVATVASLAVMLAAGAAWGAGAATRDAGGGGFVLEIGHDTTRVMGPIAPDGTIDYGHALWEKMHAGVTAENNGYSVLMGMAAKFKEVPEKLGDSEDGIHDPWDETMAHPWKAKEYPGIAAWLKENAFVLDAARGLVDTEKGRKLTRWCPPEPAKGAVFQAWPWGARLMEVDEALQARAMGRLGEGDQAGALEDAETMVRIGELVGSEPQFVAISEQQRMQAYACRVAVAGARLGTAAQKRQWLAFVKGMSEVGMNPEELDVEARFGQLAEVMTIVRGDVAKGLGELTLLNLTSLFVPGAGGGGQLKAGDLDQVDWNEVMRKINAQADEEVRIAKEPGVKAYRDAKALADRVDKADVPGNVFDAVLGPSLESPEKGTVADHKKSLEDQVNAFVKRRAGESVAAFSDRIAAWVTRAGGESFHVFPVDALNAEAIQRASAVAIGLEIYKAEHGAYPATLGALVPGILKEVPADPWSAGGAPLGYAQEKGEYAVYSVGSSGKDRPRGEGVLRARQAVYSDKWGEKAAPATTRP